MGRAFPRQPAQLKSGSERKGTGIHHRRLHFFLHLFDRRHRDSFQIFFQKVQTEDRDHDLCLPHVHVKNFPLNFCFPSLTGCSSMDSTVSYHKSSAYSRTQGQPVQNSLDKAYSTIMKSSGLRTEP